MSMAHGKALEEALDDKDGHSIWGQNGGNSCIWIVPGLWTDFPDDCERWSAPELRVPSRGTAARATERKLAEPLSSRKLRAKIPLPSPSVTLMNLKNIPYPGQKN